MNYDQTIEYLFSQLPAFHRIGKAAYKNDLNNTIALDNYFGSPHLKFRSIHVTGTNGKGSVSHMIASVLQEAGYRTGLYTSPHLKDFRERIRVDGAMISENEVVDFVEKNREILESLQPSFFEMTVAMAFDHFAKRNVEVAVIEVGLGGRLDSTNIITPVLSVITNIGHDHMDLLGDSMEKIAIEKAGIIKKQIPVVISESQDKLSEIFIRKAADNQSEIVFADQNFSCIFKETKQNGERDYQIRDILNGVLHHGITVLGGDYQAKNIQAVYQVISCISDSFRISDDNLNYGISKVITNTGLSGRWQVLKSRPLTICDTGHNKEGLEYVINQINRIEKSRLHIVVGFVADKDLTAVLPLFPKDAVYYFTKASVPRAMNEELLMKSAAAYGLCGTCFWNVRMALDAAEVNASPDDVIFIGGSTFVVADIL